MDPLRHLIDHPPQDPDVPRNPVLTAQVMERIRATPAPSTDVRGWWVLAAIVVGLMLLMPEDLFGPVTEMKMAPDVFIDIGLALGLALLGLVLQRRWA